MARKPLFFELVSGAILGAKRASAETALDAEGDHPSKGDVRNMRATGKAVFGERAMTADEKRRIVKAFTMRRFMGRMLIALTAGGLLFGGGLFLFTQVVIPSGAGSDSIFNPTSWIGMLAGGSILLGITIYFPLNLWKVFAARRDVRRGRVKKVSGTLMKHSRPPEHYWVVGERIFIMADVEVWAAFPDGEWITLDIMPANSDILKIHSSTLSIDALATQGF